MSYVMQHIQEKSMFASLAMVLALAGSAQASPPLQKGEVVQEEMRKEVLGKAEAKAKDGWSIKVNVGATGSFNHSSKVVGTEDGSTWQLGAVLGGSAVLVGGQHEWENLLDFKLAQTKTPQVDSFVKSQDSLELRSTYFYHLLDPSWAGGFGRLRVATSILAGETIRGDATTIRKTNKAGDITTAVIPPQTAIELTSAFEPLVLRETVGAFANPIEGKRINFKSKLGLALQHLLTRNGYAIRDDDTTPELDLAQLDNAHEFGGELTLALDGVLIDELLAWKAGAEFFLPFVTDSDLAIEGIDRLNSDLNLGISLKLLQWLSLDYNVSAKRVPLVLEEWQVTNGLMLTAGFQVL